MKIEMTQTCSRNVRDSIGNFVGKDFGDWNERIGRWSVEWSRQNLVVALQASSHIHQVFIAHLNVTENVFPQIDDFFQPLAQQNTI